MLMRIWIDCEWADFRGQLLSMALVAEDGREFYAERLYDRSLCNEWVQQNVLPHLDRKGLTERAFCRALGRFLDPYAVVELIADWPEDIARFMDALTDEPGMLVWRGAVTARIVSTSYISKLPHHALHDAIALKDACITKGLAIQIPM